MQIFSKSPGDTQKIAADLLKKIENFLPDGPPAGRAGRRAVRHGKTPTSRGRATGAIVIALEGELGAGKTVFVKGLAKAMKIRDKIKSPTFVLLKKYKTNPNLKFKILKLKFLYHLDCYRLKDEKDLIQLGIKEILAEPHNLVAIEWSDRVKKILPKKHIKVHIDHIDKNTRKITILNFKF